MSLAIDIIILIVVRVAAAAVLLFVGGAFEFASELSESLRQLEACRQSLPRHNHLHHVAFSAELVVDGLHGRGAADLILHTVQLSFSSNGVDQVHPCLLFRRIRGGF